MRFCWQLHVFFPFFCCWNFFLFRFQSKTTILLLQFVSKIKRYVNFCPYWMTVRGNAYRSLWISPFGNCCFFLLGMLRVDITFGYVVHRYYFTQGAAESKTWIMICSFTVWVFFTVAVFCCRSQLLVFFIYIKLAVQRWNKKRSLVAFLLRAFLRVYVLKGSSTKITVNYVLKTLPLWNYLSLWINKRGDQIR